MSQRPIQKTVVKVVVGGTILLAAWIIWGSFNDPEAMWAPGNLRRSHAAVASCAHCHVPFHGPSSAKCTGCHSEEWFTQASMPEIGQRHVTAIQQQRSCLACHTEHQGRR